MLNKTFRITENTLIPVSLVITIASVVYWLSTIYLEEKAHGSSIEEIKNGQQEYIKTVQTINERLSRIEGYLLHEQKK